jgi:hypothetical protein
MNKKKRRLVMAKRYMKFGLSRTAAYETQIREITKNMKQAHLIMPEEEAYVQTELDKEIRYG